KMTMIVVVLIPPPVEPGDAPINISSMDKTVPPSVNAAVSTVLKPAVLGVIDWKSEASSLSIGCIAASTLPCSMA
ncbi:hypothetical protein AT727_24880, partial [Desulfitobacterium hafniense]